MSVFILATGAETPGWADVAAQAVRSVGVAVRLHVVEGGADSVDVSSAAAGSMSPDTRIVLASARVPPALIGAVFRTPLAQASRKIVDVAAAGDGDAAVPALFDVVDMLIFTPAAAATAMRLAAVPTRTEDLLPARSLLVRHNQALVVRFPAGGAAAVWADRTMFVAAADPADPEGSAARFSATIAAAVARGIGPEPALELALVAAARPAEIRQGFPSDGT